MKSVVFNSDWKLITHQYPDKYFDLLCADVPYGIDVENMAFMSEFKQLKKQKNGTYLNARKRKKKFKVKGWDKVTPDQSYFDEVVRISKNQIIFGVDYVKWSGLGPGRLVWDKLVADGMSFNRYEKAYCSFIEDEVQLPLLWSGMMQAESLSNPTVQQGNKQLNEKRIHPCHKPILLYKKIFMDYGFPGMKVIDTHLGGGSIRIAADMFGVGEFVGCEVDEEYFKDQEERWRVYKSQYKIIF